MAAKFFMNGGVNNNYSDDTNWSTTAATGPNNTTHATSADTVTVNASSPNITIDATSAATSINFTGYTGTLTVNANLTLTASSTLVAGMTIAGTAGTIIISSAGAVTFTTASKTLTCSLTYSVSAGAITTSGTVTVNGVFTCATVSSANATITGGQVNAVGGLTLTGAGGGWIGTTVVVIKGGTFSSSAGPHWGINTNFDGDSTVSGTIFVVNWNSVSFTIAWVSGTITTTGSTIRCDVGGVMTQVWNCANITWDNFTASGISATYSLTGNLNIGGTLTISTSCTFSGAGEVFAAAATLATGTNTLTLSTHINVQGTTTFSSASGAFTINSGSSKQFRTYSYTHNNNSNLAGTATLVFNGTGTWSHPSAGSGCPTLPVTINCSANTLTVSGTVKYNTGTLTWTAGTVTVTSSTLALQGSCTLNTSGMSWNNVTISAAATVTINSALTISATLTLPDAAVTFAGSFGWTCATLANTTITATRIFTFAASVTYTVTTAWATTHAAAQTVRFTFTSSSGSVKAIFILNRSATQDIGFVDPTRIDSNGGQQIFTYHGVVTTSFNWTATYAHTGAVGSIAVGYAG